MKEIQSLSALWEHVNTITKQHYPDNRLMPILGGGKEHNPKFMIVFINPTARNISSNPSWNGPRFPFIGRKRPWVEFSKAGLFDETLLEEVKNNENAWSLDFTEKVRKHLEEQEIFVTNIVKNTGEKADLPKADQINLYTELFKKEIEIVNPQYIIAFGLIPIKALLKENLKLSDYYTAVKDKGAIITYDLPINGKNYKVIPCYYPIGRGNPHLAVELLRLIKETL